jgi:hypothetical protein
MHRGTIEKHREDFMRKTLWLTAIAALALVGESGPDSAAAQTRTTLDIYVVDVEGGNATLLVAPSGESLLIDTGNVAPAAAISHGGSQGRWPDPDRQPDHHPLAWRSLWRHGGAREAHPDPTFHRPRPQCTA